MAGLNGGLFLSIYCRYISELSVIFLFVGPEFPFQRWQGIATISCESREITEYVDTNCNINETACRYKNLEITYLA